jgi:4-hydroxybenzoate polyprenyltransferase
MITLLLATKMEAEPLAEKLGASQVAGEPFATWRFEPAEGRPGGVIVVAGMGKDAAARGTEHLITACGASMVINVGICGALSDGVTADELMRISGAVDGDAVLADQPAAPVPCSLSAWMDLPARRLASVSTPVFDDHQRLKLAAFADAVDMEGYAVAEVCRRHGVTLFMLKGVTDLANHTGKQDILSNIGRVSTRLAGAVVAGLAAEKWHGQVLGTPNWDAHATCLAGRQAHGQVLGTPDGDVRATWGGASPGKVMSFAKIEHGVFSLPLLLAGAKLGAEAKLGSAGAWPSLGTLGLIALAGIGARTMGIAMNRVLDRKLDAMNPRTAGRELPSGRMTFAAGLAVAAAGLGLYLLACGLLGPPCLALSPVPAVPLITYSLLKRFTNLCHFGIGLCLALAPLGAYVVAAGTVSMSQSVLLLGLFTFCWMSGFDIIYALQDLDSDRQTGVRSLPVSLGPTGASAVAAGLHVVALAALALLWRSTGGGWFSCAAGGVAVAAFVLGNLPSIPAAKRFFPISAIASIAGSSVPLMGGLG